MTLGRSLLIGALALSCSSSKPNPTPAADQVAPPAQPGSFPPEKLESIVAPIALFPDPVLGQVFEASVRPQEVAAAAAWIKANPGVTGQNLDAALKNQSWHDSVKALVGLPDVLKMLSDHTDWARDLSSAYSLQKSSLLFAVQQL